MSALVRSAAGAQKDAAGTRRPRRHLEEGVIEGLGKNQYQLKSPVAPSPSSLMYTAQESLMLSMLTLSQVVASSQDTVAEPSSL